MQPEANTTSIRGKSKLKRLTRRGGFSKRHDAEPLRFELQLCRAVISVSEKFKLEARMKYKI